MSADQAGFKVSDQRHFAADGTPRTLQSEQGPPVAERQAEVAGNAPAATAMEVDFSSFILSLASQASILLRGEDGRGEDVERSPRDRQGAQQIIAVLEMLQDKTEARRTAEETRLLDGLLFQLRMGFVTQGQRGTR